MSVNTTSVLPYSLGEKHILISTLNHAGMDALNGFQIYISFFNAIGLLSAGDAEAQFPKDHWLVSRPLQIMTLITWVAGAVSLILRGWV